ncbi:glycosyltransferase family 2 protein [Psychroflexus montanilacus]|uniref:glycosyltransferase family 2 protein n=1 Tax=Psychroflexus montanilacus TaxID=2873598 RepID=UPI001CCABAC0|nr:glycosyltransferase family A protein [Psychroflexus montanilacus]MBZ9652091.1 glycosyltransferase family 2 protein [Psychroflexus montanilacus]
MPIFNFLKYVQPTHYFHLLRENEESVFPIVEKLDAFYFDQVPKDEAYQSNEARVYDQSWRMIQKGYIGEATKYSEFESLPLVDEYRFVRKNFHKAWVLYVLLIRLASFKNPFKEVTAYFKTRQVKHVNEHQHPIDYPEYKDFQSELIQQNPLVSVIIPTLNRYSYLKDVLKDLEQQEYTNFEVIVVDQSEPFQKEFYEEFNLNINLIYQEEKALWLARNKAIKQSKGNYILLFDDDSRVDTDWITEHLKTLDYFKSDLSSGVSISTHGAKIPANYAHFGISSQLDTGNVLLKKGIFKDIGLFDRQFEKQRMGDGEFGLRAYLAGYQNISNPYAKRLHLKVGSGGLRQMGSWDGFRPKKWLDPRPIPSVVYLFRKYHGNEAARLALLKTVPSSIMPYRYKSNSLMMVVGVLISILISPLVLVQVFKSWSLASDKLKEGAKIEELE